MSKEFTSQDFVAELASNIETTATEQTNQSSSKKELQQAFEQISGGDKKKELQSAFNQISGGGLPQPQNKYNQKAVSNLPVPDKYRDPMQKMKDKYSVAKGMSFDQSTKVVKQQGRFGAVDDDECMGSNVNSK